MPTTPSAPGVTSRCARRDLAGAEAAPRSTWTSPSSAPVRSVCVLGILLAQRGRSVVVLEQWPTPYTLPRAVHFDHEVGRILQSCGIGDELRAISEPAEIYEWRNGQGTTLLRFGRVGASLSGWPFSSMFCQPELEAAPAPTGRVAPDARGPPRRPRLRHRTARRPRDGPPRPGSGRPGSPARRAARRRCVGARSVRRRL